MSRGLQVSDVHFSTADVLASPGCFDPKAIPSLPQVNHFTHTSAYVRWLEEGHGILWYTNEDQLERSPILAASTLTSRSIPGACALYCQYSTQLFQDQANRMRSAATDVCLALIIRYLRLGCMKGNSWHPELLKKRLQELAAQDAKLDIIWRAIVTQAAPIRELVTQFSKLMRIASTDGIEPIVVIDNLELLDGSGLPQFLGSLDDTVGKHTRILLAGTNSLWYKGF